MAYWAFQADPSRYRILAAALEHDETTWTANDYANRIQIGDTALIWISGPNAGGYALGQITATAKPIAEDPALVPYGSNSEDAQKVVARVRLRFTRRMYLYPLLRKACEEDTVLSQMLIIQQPAGTIFPITEAEFARILETLASRPRDWTPAELVSALALYFDAKAKRLHQPEATATAKLARLLDRSPAEISALFGHFTNLDPDSKGKGRFGATPIAQEAWEMFGKRHDDARREAERVQRLLLEGGGLGRGREAFEAESPRAAGIRLKEDFDRLRQDPTFARRRLEQLLPETMVREACLTLFADTIERAQSFGAACWGVTLRKSKRIHLNVGRCLAVGIYEGRIFLGLHEDEMSKELREFLSERVEWRSSFDSLKGSLSCIFPADRWIEIWPSVEKSYWRFVEGAVNTVKQTPWFYSHSPGFVIYSREALSRPSLPDPVYDWTARRPEKPEEDEDERNHEAETGTFGKVLALVNTLNDIRASVARFNVQALQAKDRARTLLRTTTYWVFDPTTAQFGPSKFVGFAGIDFATYEMATKEGATGASFDGLTTRTAIEKASGMGFLPDLHLAAMMLKWGDALLGPGTFEGLAEETSTWKFLVLTASERRYWKIAPGGKAMFWEENRASGVIAIGWAQAGDPRQYQSKEELEAHYSKVFSYNKNQAHVAVRAVRWFIHDIKPGDIILATQGKSKVMGRGVVLGSAEFRAERGEFGNCMPVHWFDPKARDIPQQRSWISTILEINADLYAAVFNSVQVAESHAGTEVKDASSASTLEEPLGGRPTGKSRAADGVLPEASAGPSKAIQVDANFDHSASAAVAVGTSPQAHGTLNMSGMTVNAGTVVFAGASTSGATESWTQAPSVPSSRPTPSYPDAETRALSEKLAATQVRRQRLQGRGADTADVELEILDLKRRLREGGQLKPGDSLSDERFLLLDVVGRGGFATVWRAHDAKSNEIVALKVLHSNLTGDLVRLDRFRRGARVMSHLQHELIVRVLENYVKEGGWHYFAMEYLSGGDLRQAVLEGRVNQDQIVPLMVRVCDAVNWAHSQRIVHRDIKPANILLDQHSQPKLTDFDLVGVVDTTGGTRTGALGTIYYTAPEALSRPMDADSRADVYSLGMTILFGLYGADLPVEVLRGPESVFDSLFLTDSLKSVIARAVDWDSGRRYSNAGELRNALEAAMKNPEAPPIAGHWSDEEYYADEPVYPPLFSEIHTIENPPPSLSEHIEYKRYHNSRFGFSVDVPTFLSPRRGPANGDGRGFTYKKAVHMVASGIRQWDENATVQSAFQEEMVRAAEKVWLKAPEGFIEGNSFTIKTREKNTVTYKRTTLANGIMAGVYFTFPAAQEAYFGSVAQRVLASLQPPDRLDPRQG